MTHADLDKIGIWAWFGYYGVCKFANACLSYYGKESPKKKKIIVEKPVKKWR